MATREQIKDAFRRLPAGTENVVLRLKSGAEVTGTFTRRLGGAVELERDGRRDLVDIDQVEDILLVWESPGPE